MNISDISGHLAELADHLMQADQNSLLAAAAATAVVVPSLIAFLYRKCSRGKTHKNELILSNIHFYAGSPPNSRNNKLCIDLLHQNPQLVNKPLPAHSYVCHGYTPFLRACWNNNFELIQYMVLHGAELRITNSDGEGALYLVAYRASKSTQWDPRALNLLWNSGCSVDAVNVYNNSMLHLAAKAGHATLVRWLLLHGAEPNVINSAGFTPRALALRKGSPAHLTVASLLKETLQDDVKRRFVFRDGGVELQRARSFSSRGARAADERSDQEDDGPTTQ